MSGERPGDNALERAFWGGRKPEWSEPPGNRHSDWSLLVRLVGERLEALEQRVTALEHDGAREDAVDAAVEPAEAHTIEQLRAQVEQLRAELENVRRLSTT
jgi:hypothetical protein